MLNNFIAYYIFILLKLHSPTDWHVLFSSCGHVNNGKMNFDL